MKLSEEMAVRLHRMMWSDMQRELGDCPSCDDRLKFKHEWIKRNFPSESVASDCWLCEYASSVAYQIGGDPYCVHCPIKWPNRHCNTMDFSYAKEPISEILAVPAKNKEIADEKCTEIYNELSESSGLSRDLWLISDHIKAIQKKAIEEYEPLKQMNDSLTKRHIAVKDYLAKQSGLDHDRPVDDHIREIVKNSMEAGAAEERVRIQEKIYEVLLS